MRINRSKYFFQRYAASLPYLEKRSDERGKINSATRSHARLSTAVWRILAYTLLEIQHSHTERPRTRSQFGHRCTRAHRRNLPASWTNKPFSLSYDRNQFSENNTDKKRKERAHVSAFKRSKDVMSFPKC